MKRGLLYRINANRSLLLMIAPATLFFFIFNYIPMAGIVLAFKQFRYDLGILNSPWVGLDNFKFFFLTGDAFNVTRNTLLYNAAFIVINNALQIVVAILLAEVGSKLFRKTAQTLMFLPYFISWVVVGAVAYNLFNYEFGAINTLLKSFGMEPLDIYTTAEYWKYILIFFSAWKVVGYGAVFYMASILSIDKETYEAADIDGANVFQRILHITLPSLRPTILILVLLAIGGIFRGDFGLFYQLVGNNGMLFQATDVIDTYVYRSLLVNNEVGMSAAIGFYQSVLCFVTILATNYLVRRTDRENALF
ncbi:ABC transporter permease [Paenibacillus mucilaginosus]|uniref:Binding-protein-dependent transport system inner membrane component n=3 Tax=Paenibacillus mucilaginosus TaxID=61624 RepID=H6NAB0_9BACL|nr:ABC transporter permease subunit [Paenibacillus mucilaginosus]AEI40750.1 binding-protein-dependent transport system inner membrane component [Paenibacillus mucilaginosus KNP414]AFC29356.1 binding-protein-dependent transport system inner membrane component [Paenibacillus mucilaginosus 3016]AFH61536.1 sugar ABC transporter permease [Paenibacillus mucilaginosus K02]MCG7211770.1 ABC transporter permease subunit [Paenibacillus mucilaginosus]WDM29878.1 sugar ABC transporter permease [Paenibacillu